VPLLQNGKQPSLDDDHALLVVLHGPEAPIFDLLPDADAASNQVDVLPMEALDLPGPQSGENANRESCVDRELERRINTSNHIDGLEERRALRVCPWAVKASCLLGQSTDRVERQMFRYQIA
jgi:hypothetical protein